MKIVIVSTSESVGGASVAARRLMVALRKAGQDVKMLVRDKQTDDPDVVSVNSTWLRRQVNFLRFCYERWVIFVNNRFSRKRLFEVSIANTGVDISRHPLVMEADIVHLHWVNQGFMSLRNLKKIFPDQRKPLVWTMHDMWVGTGICHIVANSGSDPYILNNHCVNYKEQCGNCALLAKPSENDLSRRTWKRKQFIGKMGIRFVAVSTWLRDRERESSLLYGSKIDVIPNVIDTEIFKPSDKALAREALGLPAGKKIIVMGAAVLNNPIKGFEYLRSALKEIAKRHEDCFLALFGNIKNAPSFLDGMPVPYKHFGALSDPCRIATLYGAADVTVVSSMFETFGQTLIEAMACGCPAVSFNNSGQTDIIDHKENGYLAMYKNAEDLADGIKYCVENQEILSKKAREKVLANYSEAVVAEKYISLYKELLKL